MWYKVWSEEGLHALTVMFTSRFWIGYVFLCCSTIDILNLRPATILLYWFGGFQMPDVNLIGGVWI